MPSRFVGDRKAFMAYDEKLAAKVRRALGDRTEFSEKKMFGGICFLVRGHMCCGLADGDLMLRVGVVQAEALLRESGTRPMDFTGKPMRGYLFVQAERTATAREVARWVAFALDFVRTLPAKRVKESKRRTSPRT